MDNKVDIIGMIDRGSSLTAIAEKFGNDYNTTMLRELATKKRWLSLKQAKIADYFSFCSNLEAPR